MSDVQTVKQSTFIKRYDEVWKKFDELCLENGVELEQIHGHDDKTTNSEQKKSNLKSDNYPLVALYRQICEHYALAKQRHYSPALVLALHQRVMIGHELIYKHKKSTQGGLIEFIFYTFPVRLRQYQKLFWIAFAVFYLPCILMGVACYFNDELIYSVMSDFEVANMQSMYDPANRHVGRESSRASDTDLMMFGHYIKNNISIDFTMYGSGIFAGVGTILALLYNGVVIGAVAGHLTGLGFGETFWQFVVGHGSFELTAAVIAGMAGLRLGLGVIAPAPYTRKDALVVAGKESIELLLGAGLMTFIAAFIEAFWSSSSMISYEVKYMVAAILWGLVIVYLTLTGRAKQ